MTAVYKADSHCQSVFMVHKASAAVLCNVAWLLCLDLLFLWMKYIRLYLQQISLSLLTKFLGGLQLLGD